MFEKGSFFERAIAVDNFWDDEMVKFRKSLEIDSGNFHQFIKSSKIVIIDIYGPRCPPCKLFEPIFLKTAKQMGGSMKFGFLNGNKYGDIENELSAQARNFLGNMGIRFYPTQVILIDGKLVGMHEGKFNSGEEFIEWINSMLGKGKNPFSGNG